MQLSVSQCGQCGQCVGQNASVNPTAESWKAPVFPVPSKQQLRSRVQSSLFCLAIVVSCLLGGRFSLEAGAGPPLASVTLAWDPSPVMEQVSYRIYYGSMSGAYDHRVDTGESTTATIEGLVPGQQYFFAATAINEGGLESGFSNEVPYKVPPPKGRLELSYEHGRGFVLKGTGAIGKTYYLQASRNLVDWQVVAVIDLGAQEAFELLSPVPTSEPICFLRLIEAP